MKGAYVKPLMLGYQSAHGSAPDSVLRAGREKLVTFAMEEGFALGPVLVEGGRISVPSAVDALKDLARRENAAVVAVPTGADLGFRPDEQEVMRRCIEHVVGVPVRVLTSSP
jgi:hypothetical protein